jgi:transcription initiation factor TFIID subunit 2
VTAFDGLLLSKWYAPKVMNYMFTVIMHDSSTLIRRRIARGLCESLALLFSVGEIKSISKDGESLLIEEDSTAPDRSLEARRSDPKAMVKSLQKDKEIGKNEVLREGIMPVLLYVSNLVLNFLRLSCV